MNGSSGERTGSLNLRPLAGLIAAVLIVFGALSLGYGILNGRQSSLPYPQASTGAPSTTPQHTNLTLPASPPSQLDIPTISVKSSVTQIGLNADGSPAVPVGVNVDKAAWLTTSATPGETGTAVIIGHVDTLRSGPSVFYDLGKLHSGDTVFVLRQDNRTAVFTVRSVQAYDKNSFPSEAVYGKAGSPELRLITCTGAWDASSHQYSKNLVAFASLTGVR